MVTYSLATPHDLSGVINLLRENQLPTEDVHHHLINFIVAKFNGNIIGSIGMERYGDEALLRSLAVSKEYRNQQIGRELYSTLLSYAKQNGIKAMHLLTTTAEYYFKKLDFEVTDRNAAPDAIKRTLEFSSLCPSSSIYMVKKIG